MRSRPSGKFVLRIPPGQHAALQKLAARNGVSLNALCSGALGDFLRAPKTRTLLSSIRDAIGGNVVGVLLFGSRARGEERDDSDTDLLVVLDRTRPLVRALYEQWDEAAPLAAYSPHFVHLPESVAQAGSLWLEAAVDGVILEDPQGNVSRFLGSLRRAIASGQMVRRTAHGHPYWVRNKGAGDV